MKTQQSANTNRGCIDCDSCPMLGDIALDYLRQYILKYIN